MLTDAQRNFSKLVAELLAKEWHQEQQRLQAVKSTTVRIEEPPVTTAVQKAPRGVAKA